MSLAEITLNGEDIAVKLGPGITAAGIDLNIESSPTITLTVRDQARTLYRSGLLDHDENGKLDNDLEFVFGGAKYRMVRVGKTGDAFQLTCQDLAVAVLAGRVGQVKTSPGASHVDFARRLVTDAGFKFVTPSGKALPETTSAAKAKTAQKDADDRREPGIGDKVRVTVKGAAASAEQRKNMNVALSIARELNATPLAMVALAAACTTESGWKMIRGRGADQISFGILQLVESIHGAALARSLTGAVRAFLTRGFTGEGGAIALAKAHPDWPAYRIAQAVQGSGAGKATNGKANYGPWVNEGREIVKAFNGGTLDAAGGGTGGDGSSPTRGTTANPAEDTWTALQRIALEKGYRCFADRNKVIYIREQDLIRSRPRAVISETVAGVDWVDWEWMPKKKVNTASVQCRSAMWQAPPGSVAILEGCGPADGRWIVSSFQRSLFSTSARIELRRGTALLKPQPVTEPTTGTIRSASEETSSSGTGGLAPVLKKILNSSGGFSGGHDGVDLICDADAPLYAICDARVIDVRAGGWWGKNPTGDVTKGDGIIQLECTVNIGPFKKGMHFGYGHAEKATVRVGDTVKAGEQIGRAGFANAWHIHFMVNAGNTTSGVGDRDPMPFVRYANKYKAGGS